MSFADKVEQVSRIVMKAKKYKLLPTLVNITSEEELKEFYRKNELHKFYKGDTDEKV